MEFFVFVSFGQRSWKFLLIFFSILLVRDRGKDTNKEKETMRAQSEETKKEVGRENI